MKEHSIDGYIA